MQVGTLRHTWQQVRQHQQVPWYRIQGRSFFKAGFRLSLRDARFGLELGGEALFERKGPERFGQKLPRLTPALLTHA